MNKLVSFVCLLAALSLAVPAPGAAVGLKGLQPDVQVAPAGLVDATSCAEAAANHGASIGEVQGELTPEETDYYCVFTGTGTLTVDVDTVSVASAVDLYACIVEFDYSAGACGDDEVPCSHEPASGFACPSTTHESSPGFKLVLVSRYDWTWVGEPVVGEYLATFSDGDGQAVAIEM